MCLVEKSTNVKGAEKDLSKGNTECSVIVMVCVFHSGVCPGVCVCVCVNTIMCVGGRACPCMLCVHVCMYKQCMSSMCVCVRTRSV